MIELSLIDMWYEEGGEQRKGPGLFLQDGVYFAYVIYPFASETVEMRLAGVHTT